MATRGWLTARPTSVAGEAAGVGDGTTGGIHAASVFRMRASFRTKLVDPGIPSAQVLGPKTARCVVPRSAFAAIA